MVKYTVSCIINPVYLVLTIKKGIIPEIYSSSLSALELWLQWKAILSSL